MKFKSILLLASASILLATSGCKTMESHDDQKQPAQADTAPTTNKNGQTVTKVKSISGDYEGEVIGTIRPKSKFARLKIGMTKKQVDDLIGAHNDQNSHISGKAFIPFYFGRDAYRTEYYYKKEGRLIFAAGGMFAQGERLLKIVVNTKESGYANN